MELSETAKALEALGHLSRLQIVELLAREPAGLSAGEIAATLGVRKSTLSSQLGILLRAGVLEKDRKGRQIFFKCDREGIAACLSSLQRVFSPNAASRIGQQTKKWPS